MDWFDSKEEFILFHKTKHDLNEIDTFIIE